jgi:TolB-like protein/Tfp pilus assembly protein PilF
MATRHLAAIMFTDMVGYTALMQENEQLALQKRSQNMAIFENSLSKYDGTLLQYYGDGTLSINTSAVNAILSAIEMQTLCRQENIDLRIGIHIGEILKDENGIYGDSVNVASRIESLALPGSIFISEKIYDDIKNYEGIHARLIGSFELKNVKQPLQVYAVSNAGIVVPSRDEVKGKIKETLNSIAVLPFVSLSSDPENEFFCDGMTEELLNVLSGIDGLQVTSRTSAFSFKGTKEDIRDIAAKLNVKKILEGSVRKAGNKVRITAQLINASDGYHLWSESYERNFEDIFELQDDISRTIANKLRKNLASTEHEKPLVRIPTENMEAYKKYMQGIHYCNKQNIPEVFKGLQCFYEAIELEPNFVNPYCSISQTVSFFAQAGIFSVDEAARRCGQAAAEAMRIDPTNAWSQLAAGVNAFYFEWDMKKAERCLEKAIELNPNLSNAHLYLGWFHLVMLQRDRIEEPLRDAYRLDPVNGLTLAGNAEICLLSYKFEKALEYCNEALAIDFHNDYAEAVKAFVIGFTGDWNKAVEMIEPLYRREPDFNFAIMFLGYAYAKAGQTEKASEFISILEEKRKHPDAPSIQHLLALLYLATGDKEKFYEYYEASMKRKVISTLFYFNSPLLEEVTGEERIMKLRREYGLPV